MKHVQVKCPMCGHEETIEIHDMIEVHQDGALKNSVNSFEIFKYSCNSCQQSIPLVYPVTYHDIEKKLMIHFDPEINLDNPELIDAFEDRIEKEYDELKGYTKRLVRDPDSLKEKILIRDVQLDDRLIEILKAYYIYKVTEENPKIDLKQILFNQKDGVNSFVFISENTPMFATEISDIIMDRLEILYRKRILEVSHDDFMLVDLEWAYRVIDQKH